MSKQKDNSTARLKISLRRQTLTQIDNPVILETHAGYGVLYEACYTAVEQGIAIEKRPEKAEHLARQRPTWAVYEGDALKVLTWGGTNHLPINFVDLDPYGDPWPFLDAFLAGRAQLPDRWALVVNDGLRAAAFGGTSWAVGALKSAVARYGNAAIKNNYLEICQEMAQQKAGQAGYNLARWAGYYCGRGERMTHYAAIFER